MDWSSVKSNCIVSPGTGDGQRAERLVQLVRDARRLGLWDRLRERHRVRNLLRVVLARRGDVEREEPAGVPGRTAGLEVWAYVCMGPRYPYANWLSDHPLVEARVIWWQAFHQKMDGLLYWGVNIWGRDNNDAPIDPGAGPLLDWSITTGGQHDWLHGDGVLVYPGKAGPIGSIRLANIRDGLEDYEYLHRLAELGEDIDKAREACLPVTEDLTHFTREPEVVLETREGIARQVAR